MNYIAVTSDDAEIKFETYRFYLESFSNYLCNEYTDIENFLSVCSKHSHTLQGVKSFDAKAVESKFKIAWNTEFLLNSDLGDINLTRINNQWAPIQAYYAIYSSAEAFACVLDGTPSNTHKSTLRKVTAYFARSGLPPWSFAYRGCRGKGGNDHLPINFPPNISVPHHLQRYGVESVQMIAKCLKAEHNHRIDDLWSQKTGMHKHQYDPRDTSFLHFMYRLRIKSNYKETDLFITKAPDQQIYGFASSLKTLCTWSIAYFETLLARKCGKRYLLELIEKYIELNPKNQALLNRSKQYIKLF